MPNVRYNLDSKSNIIFAVFRYKVNQSGSTKILKWSTGEKIEPRYWNYKSQRAKNVKGQTDLLTLNKRLNEIADIIREVYRKNGYGNINREDFKEQIDISLGLKVEEKTGPENFLEFVQEYNQRRRDEPGLSRETWKNWFSWEKHLAEFYEATAYPKDFDKVDYNFLEAYVQFLYEEKEHSINYVSKQIAMIRQWMHDAARRDYHSTNKYEGFSVSKIDTNRVCLYEDELETLYKYEYQEERLETTRDLFLMQTATLLRRSDLKRLTPDHIHTLPDGRKLIDVVTEKTNTKVAIPVFWYLEPLLEKYNYQIPEKKDHVFNRQLKECCRIAGLDRPVLWLTSKGGTVEKKHRPLYEVVASHCARRSGATKLILDGHPKSFVMKLTGHSSEQEFNKYVVVGDRMAAAYIAEKYDRITGNENKLRAI